MKGVIMAGGFGTRLKPLTINRPKPMVPVANRPIMEHIVTLLRKHGITDLRPSYESDIRWLRATGFRPEDVASLATGLN